MNDCVQACFLVFTDSPALWATTGPRAVPLVIETKLCDEGRALNQTTQFWRQQWFHDPEARIHKGFHLYLTWNLKPYFLQEATRLNPFRSQYFFWIDAGYMRSIDQAYGDVRSMVPTLYRPAMHFLLVGDFGSAELRGEPFRYTVGQDRVAGNMFGGHASTIQPWAQLYYQTFQTYINRGWFVGKDQNIFNTLCIEHPDACVLLKPHVWFGENPWFKMWDCLFHHQRPCSTVSPKLPPHY